MASPISSISSISSMSSSSSSVWYSSSSEEDAIMHNMIMNAAQVFMASDKGSSQRLTRRTKYNRDQEAGAIAWQSQYIRGDHGHPTIILKAVASQDLWIWHAFFGLPGSLNNLNIIYQSQIFKDVVAGTGPDTSFTVSGVEYRRGYYLAYGIYPTYSTIVKTIPHPTDEKRKKSAKFQEGARKDIEWAFGVLQKNGTSFHIQHVHKHQRGYDTLCTLVSSFIT
ncbi:putative harbinger transposase-derived protein [Helianthus debilis subsp. tardiflorus]